MFFKKLNPQSLLLPFLLLLLSLAVWIEMDLFVPSLPDAMRYFDTNEKVIQWTFSFNFFGFFISSLFCGALSDALGRRPVLLWGTALFTVGGILTASSTRIDWFLFGRLLQGLGVAGPAVVTMAILADIYQGTLFKRWVSILNALVTLVMAAAPLLGAYLNHHLGWRSNFLLIAIFAVVGFVSNWLWLPETLHANNRKPFHLRLLLQNYKRLLGTPRFACPMIGISAFVAPYFIFVGVAPLLYMNQMKLPLSTYVILQSSIVGVFSFFSLLISALGERINLAQWNKVGVYGCLLCNLGLLAVGLYMHDNPYVLTVFMCFFAAFVVVPCVVLYSEAIEVYPDLQASAGALFQSTRMLLMSIGSALAGAYYSGSYAPIGLISFSYVFLGFVLIWRNLQPK